MSIPSQLTPPTRPIDWEGLIPSAEWAVYRAAIDAVAARGLTFAVGGGMAFSAYSGRARNTKDLDLYVLPHDRDAAVAALTDAGLADLFDARPYDRGWIFRGVQGDVIVDVIWAMANRRAPVDDAWLTLGPSLTIRDRSLRLLPAEELLWAKLYILQRDRCDWPDLLNIIVAGGPALDWDRLLARLGPDVPLLTGLLAVFSWLHPARARDLPLHLWDRLGLAPPHLAADDALPRAAWLDTRDWFGPPPACR